MYKKTGLLLKGGVALWKKSWMEGFEGIDISVLVIIMNQWA